MYLIFPASDKYPATHKAPDSTTVHIKQVTGTIYSDVARTEDISAYTALTEAEKTRSLAVMAARSAYKSQMAAGIRVSDPTSGRYLFLAALESDQSKFANLVTHVRNANLTTVSFADSEGLTHTMPVSLDLRRNIRNKT